MILWLTQNWGLKLVSLVLAIGLWYYAVGEEGIDVTRNVPLEIKIKNPQMSILETSARSVQVTLVAPRALLSDLTSEKILAVHEIGSDVKTAGEYSFRLEPREVKLSSFQIRVTKIEPEIIRVTLDELMAQKLKVQPHFVGDPAFGYKVSENEIQLNPNAVLIEGPKGRLEKLDAVKTEKMDLVGRIRSFRKTVALELPPHVKPLSESLIDVYVPIREQFGEKSFENIPVRILNRAGVNAKTSVDPPAISFALKGSKGQLEKIVPEKLRVLIDASGLEDGEHEVPVEIVLPPEVSLKEDRPIPVKVNVKQ